MDAGISPEAFWEYTPQEIVDILESRNRSRRNELKRTLANSYTLSRMIADQVWSDKDHKPPKLWDYNPELFEEERKRYEEEQREAELAQYIDQRKAYAAEFNRRLRA